MGDAKTIFGYVGILLLVAGYVPYIRDVFRGTTKPHAFSWFIWSILNVIVLAAQMMNDAGPGAWVTAGTGIACFMIFLFALIKGDRHFAPIDWLFLGAAGISLALWRLTNNALLAVILVTIADAIGFLPTFRKGFHKPQEETLSLYVLSTLKSAAGVLALSSYGWITALHPASLIVSNTLCAIMLIIRRRYVR
jgi:hypothetical protein